MSSQASLTDLRIITTLAGEVRHGLKASEMSYAGFGEVYFSTVDKGYFKGWKRHRLMTLNLIVVVGTIQFEVRGEGLDFSQSFCLSAEDSTRYGRLTVPPGLWVAFGGIGTGRNMLLNIANLEHDPEEADTLPIETWPWTWME